MASHLYQTFLFHAPPKLELAGSSDAAGGPEADATALTELLERMTLSFKLAHEVVDGHKARAAEPERRAPPSDTTTDPVAAAKAAAASAESAGEIKYSMPGDNIVFMNPDDIKVEQLAGYTSWWEKSDRPAYLDNPAYKTEPKPAAPDAAEILEGLEQADSSAREKAVERMRVERVEVPVPDDLLLKLMQDSN